ncbi:MAG: MGMT family protein [Planctomycetota bacterium]|nr:MAG: MGMT family protein [Planctomycetota bacterium]
MTDAASPVFAEVLTSPIGPLGFLYSEDGELLEIQLPAPGRRHRRFGRRPAGAPSRRAVEAWIRAWFREGTADFPGRWRLPGARPFTRAVYRQVARIPAGRTRTYAEVAARCGSPGAARAVGNAMARNPLPLLVPCHRVVARQGLGGFGGGLALKEKLLAAEAAPQAAAGARARPAR